MDVLDHRHVDMTEQIRAAHTRTQGEVDAIAVDDHAHAGTKLQMLVVGAQDHLALRIRRVDDLLAHRKTCEHVIARRR